MKKILCLVFACLLPLCACRQADTQPVGESVPNPYPQLPIPALSQRLTIVDLVMYTWDTEAIFTGTVVSKVIHGVVAVDPDAGYPTSDANGRKYFGDYKLVRVDRAVTGPLKNGDEIYVVAFNRESADGKNCYPAMLPDERYVFFMNFNPYTGYWNPPEWHGFFYITDEDRVFPANVDAPGLQQYNHMRLDDFLGVVCEKSLLTEEEVAQVYREACEKYTNG